MSKKKHVHVSAEELTFVEDHRGRGRMVVGFITTCAISAYHN